MQKQNIIIKHLIGLAQAQPELTALWLYGSRARGQQNEQSDYDLAVLYNVYEKEVLERRLRPETLALTWMQALQKKGNVAKISIVDIDIIPVPLAFAVVSDNCLLYTQDELGVMQKEQQIFSKWDLDYKYHVRQYA